MPTETLTLNEEKLSEELETLMDTSMHISKFDNYLGKENNSRIIFSAPFGMGKTTFLKKYFKEYSNKYECFHLFPVNYQVASNEDVFELLKYDILNNIVQVGGLIEATEKIGKLLAVQSYLMYGGGAATINLFSNLLKLGTKIDIKSFIDFSKDAKKHYDKLNEGDGEKVEEYLNESKIKTGSIYEFDSITEIICEANKKIKEKNKKSVLVLDDLDRIDPSQIFRILNLFSAHFDSNGIEKNKFGFDKIILVCDYENIKNIFSHLYGEKTDFTGYINKFMSYLPYKYSIVDKVIDYVVENIKDKDLREYPDILKFVLERSYLSMLVENNQESKMANLRTIAMLINNKFPDINYEHIKVNPEGIIYMISPNGALSKLLSCMNLLLSNKEKILDIIEKLEMNKDKFNLIGSYWYLDKDVIANFTNLKRNEFIHKTEQGLIIKNFDITMINNHTENHILDYCSLRCRSIAKEVFKKCINDEYLLSDKIIHT